MKREARLLVMVWVALMALLAATVAASFSPFGAFKAPINLAIAATKAGLVAWVFMHLREQPALNRVVALAALAWITVLVAMTLIDIATRTLPI